MKSSLPSSSAPPVGPKYPQQMSGQGRTLSPANLVGTNPKSQQFEPTPESPLPRRQKMAGVS